MPCLPVRHFKSTPKGKALFPRVRILFDQDRRPRRNPVEVSLYGQTDLFIVRVLPNEEINPLLKQN
ncbi:MAG: hypothetical protein AB1815_00250 [Bacillota bacterium]|jgi:hypothetical protein